MDYMLKSKSELEKLLASEQDALKKLKKEGMAVDMTRGRPCKEQLELAMPMLQNAANLNYALPGGDARNYGGLGGIKPIKELFADLLDVKESEVYVADGSSLELMYTMIQFAMNFGVLGSTPWGKLDKVKFICPAPGYDRHFSICETFGIEMITVPLNSDGPNMDLVESLVETDDSIKGIWCVPKYSNPTGIVYSDKVVERMGALKPAAKDFRVFWDNAYIIHSLYGENDKLKNIFSCAKKNPNMIYEFCSTSKITFAGSGVAAMAMSEENMQDILKKMFYKQINPNKVNQLMHADYLKNVDNMKKIMAKHADILRPKFELVERRLEEAFKEDKEFVTWTMPRGGYFISLDCKKLAKRIVEIAADTGVKFTAAGATYPYKRDDLNSNIRIAPSVPSLEELDFAMDVLIQAIKVARIEKVLTKKD